MLYNDELYEYSEEFDVEFFGKDTENHMGVELEVDTEDGTEWENAYDLVTLLSRVSDMHICKEDGSLREGGVEIVTYPCTLDYHLEKFPWEDIVRVCRNEGYLSDQAGTCGLHVHVDRSYFHNDEQATVRIMYLFSKFKEQFVNFARRTSYQLTDWAYIYDNINLDEESETYSNIIASRYRAINACNYETLEFRLWKGSLNLETLYATLEMTQILCDIVNDLTTEEIKALTWEDICNEGKEYEDLNNYLKRRGLRKEEAQCA